MKTLWVGGGVCIAAQQQCPADGHNRLATRWNLQILVRNSARNTGRHGSRVDGHQSPAAEPGQIRSTRVRAARDASTSTLRLSRRSRLAPWGTSAGTVLSVRGSGVWTWHCRGTFKSARSRAFSSAPMLSILLIALSQLLLLPPIPYQARFRHSSMSATTCSARSCLRSRPGSCSSR